MAGDIEMGGVKVYETFTPCPYCGFLLKSNAVGTRCDACGNIVKALEWEALGDTNPVKISTNYGEEFLRPLCVAHGNPMPCKDCRIASMREELRRVAEFANCMARPVGYEDDTVYLKHLKAASYFYREQFTKNLQQVKQLKEQLHKVELHPYNIEVVRESLIALINILLLNGEMNMNKTNCPTCNSHDPKLHPATAFEGEVAVCKDGFHELKTLEQATAEHTELYERDVIMKSTANLICPACKESELELFEGVLGCACGYAHPSNFERENRYVVFKRTDLAKARLSHEEANALAAISVKIDQMRIGEDRQLLECVVVESDWPEFVPTWDAIRMRVEGRSLPAIGSPLAGGFFGGEIIINGERYALVVAPKAEGENMELRYKLNNRGTADGTDSDDDGLANSDRINDDNHPAAQFCRSLRIGGHDDWYLPSRDELAMLCRNLGPTRKSTPDLFKEDAAEALETEWYWSSTEHASYSDLAWVVGFYSGAQNHLNKDHYYGVRAVRRFKI